MPPDYQHALASQLSAQVSLTQLQADRLVVPLQEGNPAAAQRLATEESRIHNIQNLPGQSVVDAPRGSDPIDIPNDLTAGQATAPGQRPS